MSLSLFFMWFCLIFPFKAVREDGAVVRAAHQPRSTSSSPSAAVRSPSAVASSISAAAAAATTDNENAPDTPHA